MERKIKTSEYNDIVGRFLELETYKAISKTYGVTLQRIKMIVEKYVEKERINEIKKLRALKNAQKYINNQYWRKRWKEKTEKN